MRRYMLDTSTISYIVKNQSLTARARLANLKHGEVACISTITEAELRYGIAKSSRAATIRPAVEAFLSKIEILVWGRDEAEAYGVLRARLESRGKSLGNMDLMIAAHALASGATLVTRDKAFLQVDGLPATVNWATDL
jgi:tRNA(fMet)-specific endonuclease VapC